MNTAVADQQIQVSLPIEIYQKLSAEAERTQQAEETVARLAIETWLEERRQEWIEAEIAAFAEEYAGTEFDLDKELEAAGLECLNSQLEPWPLEEQKELSPATSTATQPS
ncbi:MAG: hypothetical protein ABI977_31755 [Acidobacteriota bacterium]